MSAAPVEPTRPLVVLANVGQPVAVSVDDPVLAVAKLATVSKFQAASTVAPSGAGVGVADGDVAAFTHSTTTLSRAAAAERGVTEGILRHWRGRCGEGRLFQPDLKLTGIATHLPNHTSKTHLLR